MEHDKVDIRRWELNLVVVKNSNNNNLEDIDTIFIGTEK